MYKDIVVKFIKHQPVTEAELNEFITTCVKNKKNIDITSQQLMGIRQAIQMGIFRLDSAIREAASELNIQITTLTDSTGKILRVDIEEEKEKEMEKGEIVA